MQLEKDITETIIDFGVEDKVEVNRLVPETEADRQMLATIIGDQCGRYYTAGDGRITVTPPDEEGEVEIADDGTAVVQVRWMPHPITVGVFYVRTYSGEHDRWYGSQQVLCVGPSAYRHIPLRNVVESNRLMMMAHHPTGEPIDVVATMTDLQWAAAIEGLEWWSGVPVSVVADGWRGYAMLYDMRGDTTLPGRRVFELVTLDQRPDGEVVDLVGLLRRHGATDVAVYPAITGSVTESGMYPAEEDTTPAPAASSVRTMAYDPGNDPHDLSWI